MTDEVREFDQRLMTLGQLADYLDISTHRLKYAIDRYKIKPTTRVGIIRVWSKDNIPLIKSAIDRIAEHRRR